MARKREQPLSDLERVLAGKPPLARTTARAGGLTHRPPRTPSPSDELLYAAEDEWESVLRARSIVTLTAIPRAEVQLYFEEVLSTYWIRHDYGEAVRRGIHVRFAKTGVRSAYVNTDYNIVTLPHAVTVWPVHLLLHELAHVLVVGGAATGHGELWQRVYLRLIRSELGRFAADQMLSSLSGKGVLSDEEAEPGS